MRNILSDIRISIEAHIDYVNVAMEPYKNNILDYFKVPLITIESTTTYKLINHFKPFHTKLIQKNRSIVEHKSKFDMVIPYDSFHRFIISDYPITATPISHDVWFFEIGLVMKEYLIQLIEDINVLIKKI